MGTGPKALPPTPPWLLLLPGRPRRRSRPPGAPSQPSRSAGSLPRGFRVRGKRGAGLPGAGTARVVPPLVLAVPRSVRLPVLLCPKKHGSPLPKKKKSFYFPSPSGGRREQRDAAGAVPSESMGLGTAGQRCGTETPSWPPRDPRGAKETPPSALPTPPGPAAALGAPGAAVRAGPAPGP